MSAPETVTWIPAPTCPGWWWRVQSWEGAPMERCQPEMARVDFAGKPEARLLCYMTEDDMLYGYDDSRAWEPVDPVRSRDSHYRTQVTHLWSGPVPVPPTALGAERA